MLGIVLLETIIGIHFGCVLTVAVVMERPTSSANDVVFFYNASNPSIHPRANDRIDNALCDRGGHDCTQSPGQYCCSDESGVHVRCCSMKGDYIQSTYKNRSTDPHWLHRFSLWNMWYFWFILVLILATCFTGCNYWRRQRRSQNFRLFQRQYTSIGGNATRNAEANGGTQIVIPITMYEVSPDTILRLMRENASYHTTTSTLSSSSGYGSPRHGYYRQQHGQLAEQQDRNLQQGPPSYGEVTSKPNMYPPKMDESEPPSYEYVSQSRQRGEAVPEEDNSDAQVERTPLQEGRSSS